MSILSGLDAAYIERLKERFWAKVDKTPGNGSEGNCWMWTASTGTSGRKNKKAYGIIGVKGSSQRAHRVSFAINIRDIEQSEVICHRCDNTFCVNPEHLFAGTQLDNVRDCIEKGRKVILSGKSHPTKGKLKLFRRGQYHHNTKLTQEKADEIRRLCSSGSFTQWGVANMFGVHRGTISNILIGRTWNG